MNNAAIDLNPFIDGLIKTVGSEGTIFFRHITRIFVREKLSTTFTHLARQVHSALLRLKEATSYAQSTRYIHSLFTGRTKNIFRP